MKELPQRLENRFRLYLNILPVVEKVGLYGSLTLGLMLSIIAVSQVALRASKYVASPYSQKYHKNLVSNSVYKACEEKVTDRRGSVPAEMSPRSNDSDEVDFEEDDRSEECLNIIRREPQYELEEDDALSDIESNDNEVEQVSWVNFVIDLETTNTLR